MSTAVLLFAGPGSIPARAAEPLTGRLLVTLAAPQAGAATGDGAVGPTREARTARAARALARTSGARPGGRVVPELGLVTVRPRPGTTLAALRARLARRTDVADVRPERRFSLRFVPNDPALTVPELAPGTPPGTPVQWWVERQGLFRAWDVFQGQGARVAVIDTGIDATHPDLADRIDLAEDRDATAAAGPATVDETGHGTHVASLACGAGNNGIGLAGAGLGCRLLVFKSDLSEGSVAQSIVDATNAGAHAIAMAFGTDGAQAASPALVEAVRYAYDHNVIMAAAAADAPVEEQGDPANVLQPTGTGPDPAQGLGLSVTAANVGDRRASFAGLGSQISLAAYGAWNTGAGGPRGLLGAFPASITELERGMPTATAPAMGCGCRAAFEGDTRYAYVQGTSMATPIVAAVGAMVRAVNPDLRAADVLRLLKETSRRPPGAPAWEPELGWGILDAGAALEATRVLDRRAPVSRVTPMRPLRGTRTLLRVTTRRDDGPPLVQSSGVARVELWRSIDGARARRIATTARGTRFRVTLRRGRRYAFHTIAVDVAGNREAPPRRPDTVLRVRVRR